MSKRETLAPSPRRLPKGPLGRPTTLGLGLEDMYNLTRSIASIFAIAPATIQRAPVTAAVEAQYEEHAGLPSSGCCLRSMKSSGGQSEFGNQAGVQFAALVEWPSSMTALTLLTTTQ